MPEFKALSLKDRDLFNKYLQKYQFGTYEYSFLTLYFWRKYCQVEYTIIKDVLVIKKTQQKEGSFFMQPLGYEPGDLPELIADLMKIKRENPAIKCLFREIEEPFLLELQEIYGKNIIYYEDIKNFDYIYDTNKLINLTGEKLKKRKNQYQQFVNSYNYVIKDIHDQAVSQDCLEFSRSWLENQKVKHPEIIFEMQGIEDILNHKSLLNLCGMAVYVDGKIVGYTIGEQVNPKMAIIHVEKGDTAYKGVYAFINKTFVEEYLHEAAYINREEDLGLAGLRKAKLAYDPLRLEKKYVIKLLE